MDTYQIIPWGFARGRWDHYRVADSVGGTLCKHQFRMDAAQCIAQRVAGEHRCLDQTREQVSIELRGALFSLSGLATTAQQQARDPAALRRTAELVHDVASRIIAMTSPVATDVVRE